MVEGRGAGARRRRRRRELESNDGDWPEETIGAKERKVDFRLEAVARSDALSANAAAAMQMQCDRTLKRERESNACRLRVKRASESCETTARFFSSPSCLLLLRLSLYSSASSPLLSSSCFGSFPPSSPASFPLFSRFLFSRARQSQRERDLSPPEREEDKKKQKVKEEKKAKTSRERHCLCAPSSPSFF